MKIGLIGLGKMGFNLALNMRDHGIDVVAFDADANARTTTEESDIVVVSSLNAITAALPAPRILWLMVPAAVVDDVVSTLTPRLTAGDILIDGGNSHFKDSIRRAQQLKSLGIHWVDCGTSGGTEGARNGACTMVGGDSEVVARIETIFKSISLPNGYLYCGPSGSGHVVKMIHNGIEYGMMQSIAEGLDVLHHYDSQLDLQAITSLWNQGSVVRGWLMELTSRALEKDKNLSSIKGVMHASGEGKWTVDTALELGVPTPAIAMSLLMRYRSQEEDTFAGKVVAALRNEFGGHKVEKKE